MKDIHTSLGQLDKLKSEIPHWSEYESTKWSEYQQEENLYLSRLESFLEEIEDLPAHIKRQFDSIKKNTFQMDYPEHQALKYPCRKDPNGETVWLTPRASYLHFFFEYLQQWLEKRAITPELRKGRPLTAKYESDHICYGKKRCHIQPNSRMAQICEKMFSPDVKIGERIHWENVYKFAYEVHEIRDPAQCKQLYLRITDINKKLERESIPSVFRQEGGQDGHVIRLL